jgi:hypothetical protein
MFPQQSGTRFGRTHALDLRDLRQRDRTTRSTVFENLADDLVL